MTSTIIYHELRSNDNIKVMEVCGTHTSMIAKYGIKERLPDTVRLVSGPGCPVCVTEPWFIDGLVEHAFTENCVVLSFGDMLSVTGSKESLTQARARGAKIRLMYTPFEVISLAKENTDKLFVIAAVGFETTIPVYAALLDILQREMIHNVKLYTSLKTMPEIIAYICKNEAIDAFICPGHVSVITGARIYDELYEKYKKPFVISGFEAQNIILAIDEIISQIRNNTPSIKNLYTNVVTHEGQKKAQDYIDRYFIKSDAYWRGIGMVSQSGYRLRDEYAHFCANPEGSILCETEVLLNPACRCTDVILGRIAPGECPLFRRVCCPDEPLGACMVSGEGACGIAYRMGG